MLRELVAESLNGPRALLVTVVQCKSIGPLRCTDPFEQPVAITEELLRNDSFVADF